MNIDKSNGFSDVIQVGNVLTVTPKASSSVLVSVEYADGVKVKTSVTTATTFGPYIVDMRVSATLASGSGASVVESVSQRSDLTNMVTATTNLTGGIIKTLWVGTQAQYDAIVTKDANTQYNTDTGIFIGDKLISGGAGSAVPSVVASRALTKGDCVQPLRCESASSIVLTINNDSTAGYTGTEAHVAYQAGTGAVSFTAGSGVTLRGSAPTAAQYATQGVMRVGANEWAYL